LLRDVNDAATLVRRVDARAPVDAFRFAKGRMLKKVMGAVDAVAGGVGLAIIGDARVPRPLHAALAGAGTVIA
jgi:acetylglutamate/LysW-gamma-L-alpha-aminoadipate kinase